MNTTTSKDGTTIAFDRLGQGPLVVLVGGALQHRALDRVIGQRAPVLAQHFTLVHYDRRGRGDSGDTPPYAVAREIEDLDAVIASVGGEAHVLGMSSGGALALAAAARLSARMKTLALYEVPFNDDPAARAAWQPFVVELRSLLTTDRRDEALALFMRHFGTPSEQLGAMRQSSVWPMLLSIAPTLAYDIPCSGATTPYPWSR